MFKSYDEETNELSMLVHKVEEGVSVELIKLRSGSTCILCLHEVRRLIDIQRELEEENGNL